MRNHPLGIYEKALAKDLSWPERLVLEIIQARRWIEARMQEAGFIC